MLTANRKTILIILSITIFYFLLILYYSKGALYIGGDGGGYYSLQYLISNFSIYEIFFPLAYVLSAGNIYLTFNIQLFLNMLLAFTSISFLVREFFRGHFNDRKLIVIETIAMFIYPLNIGAINVVWQTFLNSFNPPVAFFILFMAMIIRMSKKILSHKKISLKTILAGGIFLGLSAEVPYPNVFRVIIYGITIVFYFIFLSLLRVILMRESKFGSRNILKGLFYLLIFIASILLLSLYSLWPILTDIHHYLFTSIDLSSIYTSLEYSSSPINVFQNTIRLIYDGFLTESPYYRVYLYNPFIVVLTLIWPLFVYVLSPIFAHKREKIGKFAGLYYLTYATVVLLILMVTWDTTINPPLGFVVRFLAKNYPIIIMIYQADFFSIYVIPALYTLLVAFSIFEIYSHLKGFTSSRKEEKKKKINNLSMAGIKVLPSLVVILIIISIIIAAFPVFNGQVEGEFFNENAKGTWIPNQYFEAKNLMEAQPGNILLLPGTSQYIMTNWDYQGTVGFYNSFFYPLNIFTFSYNGGYQSFNNTYIQQYTNLTSPITSNRETSSPILVGNSASSIPLSLKYSEYGVWGANASRNFYGLAINETNSGYVHIVFYPSNDINLSSFPYARIVYNVSAPEFYESAIKMGYVSVGLGSSNGIAWWGINSVNTFEVGNSTFESYLPLDYGYSSVYNQSNVTSICLDINTDTGTQIPSFNISYPEVWGANYTINSNWLSMVSSLKIKYILFDKTLNSGLIQKQSYYEQALSMLENQSVVSLIYTSKNIDLYMFNSYTLSNNSINQSQYKTVVPQVDSSA